MASSSPHKFMYLPQYPILLHPQPMFLLSVTQQVTHPHKTGKITVVYTLIFIFLTRKLCIILMKMLTLCTDYSNVWQALNSKFTCFARVLFEFETCNMKTTLKMHNENEEKKTKNQNTKESNNTSK
jgi:hypothetical protein